MIDLKIVEDFGLVPIPLPGRLILFAGPLGRVFVRLSSGEIKEIFYMVADPGGAA